jgi:hypothetical protein
LKAWRRLKRDKNWGDWIKVGEACQVGREWAMNQAGINKPEGKGYNTAFGEWLTKYKLDDMDKGDRSPLFTVVDNLPMIEQWRHTPFGSAAGSNPEPLFSARMSASASCGHATA